MEAKKQIAQIEEIVVPEVLDMLSMQEVKAGNAPNKPCACDNGSCYKTQSNMDGSGVL